MLNHVWIWLPEETAPRACGRLKRDQDQLHFCYDEGYQSLAAQRLSPRDLELRSGWQTPEAGHLLAGALRDAAPDYWARKVLLQRQTEANLPDACAEEETALLLAGADRIGALCVTAGTEAPPEGVLSSLSLQEAAGLVLKAAGGARLTQDERPVLAPHLGVGGARPKLLHEVDGLPCLVKLAAPKDPHPIVRGEFFALELGRLAGISTAAAQLRSVSGVDALVIERFDRERAGNGWARRQMLSGLTLQGLREEEARYASYEDLARALRLWARDEDAAQHMAEELFRRMVFNILIGNTDDHARNHAAFWNGTSLELTPAYDLDPRPRLGREANQAMSVSGGQRKSSLALALEAEAAFGLDPGTGRRLILRMIEAMQDCMTQAAQAASLDPEDLVRLRGRALLNPYIFEGAPGEMQGAC